MALVALLKGVNVGGRRTFRPSVLAGELERFGVVNVGAAGTFVVRRRISRTDLRAEITRRLPFEADVMICGGAGILRLASSDPFAGQPAGRDVVRFVGVMAERRVPPVALPLDLPGQGDWGLRVLACQDRFILGLHRREMKAIRYLAQVETVLGVAMTTRSWTTILAIARILRPGRAISPDPV